MKYKKIVFSLVLMSFNSFAMSMKLPGILVTDQARKNFRRDQLQEIANMKHQEIAAYKAYQKIVALSPVSVTETSAKNLQTICSQDFLEAEKSRINDRVGLSELKEWAQCKSSTMKPFIGYERLNIKDEHVSLCRTKTVLGKSQKTVRRDYFLRK